MIARLLKSELIPMIGSLEACAIRDASAVVYSRDSLSSANQVLSYLLQKLYHVALFRQVLWMAKDNSVNNELGFVHFGRGMTLTVHSNMLATMYSRHDGSFSRETFSRSELQDCRRFYRSFISMDENPLAQIGGTRLSKEAPRLSRAIYHLQVTRHQSDLALKIASYCSALECLYATSSAELTHQLSERIACFLENSPQSRVDCYAQAKEAYGIRSRVIHGHSLKGDTISKLAEVSRRCDDWIRRSLIKILTDDDAYRAFGHKPEELDKYMLCQIFGAT